MQTTFDKLGLLPSSLAALKARGFDTPTPIQALTIPLVLKGGDVIGQAQTGTGKTLAFGLPLIEATKPGRGPPQSLVLAPTRELANQIVEELNKMAKGTPFKAMAIYGGVGFGNQIGTLRQGNITCVVACPGRLLDLIQQRAIDVSWMDKVVLDEADRMLDMGFIRDIDKIFSFLPKNSRQTLLFSATIPPDVKKLADRYLYNPESVRAETGPTATELTDQFEIPIRGDKMPYLLALLQKENPEKSVIFTKTKHGAKKLAKRLEMLGYKADSLQGNLSQNARDRVMAGFRADEFQHLVATDVAARGLDVKDITHVINYDFPMVNEDYVHRIGRTGRAGQTGRAFLFVAAGEERDARHVERLSGVRLERYDIGALPVVPAPSHHDMVHEQRERSRPQGRPGGAHRGPARHGGAGGYGGGGRSGGGGRPSGGGGYGGGQSRGRSSARPQARRW